MLARLTSLSPRARAVTLAALVVMLPLGIIVGYNLGRWIAL